MIDFIINESACSGKASKVSNKLVKLLDGKGVEYRIHKTCKPLDATAIAKRLCDDGADTLVAVGGDGTISEVLSGITDLDRVRMGIIPCGSGNDFAATAKIPLSIEKALNLILEGETKPTDFMVCGDKRGINVIGAGIDVEILKRARAGKLKGKIKYVLSLIVSLIKFKFYDFKLKKRDSYEDRQGMIVCIGNGKQFGGGIPICPEASIDDGYLDFVIVNKMRKSRIPLAFIKLMKGKIMSESFCDFSKQEQVDVVFDHPTPVQIDGEIYDDLPFKVRIEKGKLKLFRP